MARNSLSGLHQFCCRFWRESFHVGIDVHKRIPSPQEEARRTLLRRRHMLVDTVRRCKQRIKSHLLFLGINEPKELEHWNENVDTALLALQMALQRTSLWKVTCAS